MRSVNFSLKGEKTCELKKPNLREFFVNSLKIHAFSLKIQRIFGYNGKIKRTNDDGSPKHRIQASVER